MNHLDNIANHRRNSYVPDAGFEDFVALGLAVSVMTASTAASVVNTRDLGWGVVAHIASR